MRCSQHLAVLRGVSVVVSRHGGVQETIIITHHFSPSFFTIIFPFIFIFHPPIFTVKKSIYQPISSQHHPSYHSYSHSSSFFIIPIHFPYHVTIIFPFIFPFIFIPILSIKKIIFIFIIHHSIIATNLPPCLLIEKIGKK